MVLESFEDCTEIGSPCSMLFLERIFPGEWMVLAKWLTIWKMQLQYKEYLNTTIVSLQLSLVLLYDFGRDKAEWKNKKKRLSLEFWYIHDTVLNVTDFYFSICTFSVMLSVIQCFRKISSLMWHYTLKEDRIKTHGSESRGQEAASARPSRPCGHYSE